MRGEISTRGKISMRCEFTVLSCPLSVTDGPRQSVPPLSSRESEATEGPGLVAGRRSLVRQFTRRNEPGSLATLGVTVDVKSATHDRDPTTVNR
jgi:hypothetical protein